MTLFVGQVPLQPLRIHVTDDLGGPVDLEQYDSVLIRMIDPDNAPIDLDAAATTVAGAGLVEFAWPPETLFATPGDYRVQVHCMKGSATKDFSSIGVIEVYRPIQEGL